jgi:phosphomannomutase
MSNLIRAANAFSPAADATALPPSHGDSGAVGLAAGRAVDHYLDFVSATYYAHAPGARVVVDPNGGAASHIAERVFRRLGVESIVINHESGRPAHEIDVEHVRADGTHVLDQLAERVRQEGALFGLAYDYDADRGNLTWVDADGAARIPSPQTAAAINAAVALAVHQRSGDTRRAAVVASDATSCRVAQIARAFGAHLMEVETGEINVVSAMCDLEQRGYRAVVGVEGASGGTVFAGTTCRDGTLVGAGALLGAADDELRAIIASRLASSGAIAAGLAGLTAILPAQQSFSDRRTAPDDWAATVRAMEQQFPRVFEAELSSAWASFEIVYSHTSYVGPDRPVSAGYGWKARVSRPGAEGFVWIRRSKTEARIARVVGDGPDEASAHALLAVGCRLLDEAGGS